MFDRDPRIGALMHHERRGADKGQHITYVDRHVHPLERLDGPRAGAIPDHARYRLDLFLISGWEAAACFRFQATGRHEIFKVILEPLAGLSLGLPE